MGDRVRALISPQDQPEVVRVRIKEVSDELAASGKHDHNALAEATEFLQDKWSDLQQSVSHTRKRMKLALDAAWNKLTHK